MAPAPPPDPFVVDGPGARIQVEEEGRLVLLYPSADADERPDRVRVLRRSLRMRDPGGGYLVRSHETVADGRHAWRFETEEGVFPCSILVDEGRMLATIRCEGDTIYTVRLGGPQDDEGAPTRCVVHALPDVSGTTVAWGDHRLRLASTCPAGVPSATVVAAERGRWSVVDEGGNATGAYEGVRAMPGWALPLLHTGDERLPMLIAAWALDGLLTEP